MDKKEEYLKVKKELEDLQEERFLYQRRTENLIKTVESLKEHRANTNKEINKKEEKIEILKKLNDDRRKKAKILQKQIAERYKDVNEFYRKEKEIRDKLSEIAFDLVESNLD